jgi:hypothetical protein
MRIRARAASLCVAAFAVLVLLPAAAQAQDPVLTLDETNVFDSDGDGVFDPVDNCVNDANPDQANLDGDSQGDACDPDDDNDTRPDETDNCPQVPNVSQVDYDGDGIGNACDDVETTDGFAGGGGLLNAAVVSFALHSRGGSLKGSGRIIDGSVRVELLDLTTLHSRPGVSAWASGNASIDGGEPVRYVLEFGDESNVVFIEVGALRWAGALHAGNVMAK